MKARYYGVLRDDKYLMTSVSVGEENALERINKSMSMWMHYYINSKFRVVKLKERNDKGWKIV